MTAMSGRLTARPDRPACPAVAARLRPGDLAALAERGAVDPETADVAVGAGDRNRVTLSAGTTRACTARC
jgi:hypothetical protein